MCSMLSVSYRVLVEVRALETILESDSYTSFWSLASQCDCVLKAVWVIPSRSPGLVWVFEAASSVLIVPSLKPSLQTKAPLWWSARWTGALRELRPCVLSGAFLAASASCISCCPASAAPARQRSLSTGEPPLSRPLNALYM